MSAPLARTQTQAQTRGTCRYGARRRRAPRRTTHCLALGEALDPAWNGAIATTLALAGAASIGGAAWEAKNVAPADCSAQSAATARTLPNKGRGYVLGTVPFFLAVPFFVRATFRTEVVAGSVWSFEQKQGIGLGLNTAVSVRMTAIRVRETGGLLLYSPVAPTGECLALIDELGGDVEHIVLGTTLFEHKQFFAPMARAYPNAVPHAAKNQWSWPLNIDSPIVGALPAPWRKLAKCEVNDDANTRLPAEFECATLDLPPVGLEARLSFTELALYHRPSRTLLVTDAVVSVPSNPPVSISQRDLLEWADDRNVAITGLRALGLFGVRSKAKEYGLKRVRARVSETSIAAAERLGWMRMCLTALYFGQRDVLRPEQSFRDVSRPTLLVPPVLGTLVYGDGGDDAAGIAAYAWAERVSRWPFRLVIPAHLAIAKAGKREWLSAFKPFQSSSLRWRAPWESASSVVSCYDAMDVACLRAVRAFLVDSGVIFLNENRPTRKM